MLSPRGLTEISEAINSFELPLIHKTNDLATKRKEDMAHDFVLPSMGPAY